MGDRFYQAQKTQKRRLKKDAIADLEELLGTKIEGLDRATILTIDTLVAAIEKKLLQ
jgi:hypothetical protein